VPRCFSSLGCPDASLDETLALAMKHQIDAVELRSLSGTVELHRYFAEKFGTPQNLAAQVRASGVRVVALNASMHLAGATEAEREQLVAFAPWADALGAHWLRVFDGKEADAAALAPALETLRWWRALRALHGWSCDVMIETHDSLFTSEKIRRFLAAAPDAAILWDSHHTWRKGGEDPVATWRAIRASIVHVHVKDSVSVPSARHPFTYTLPGEGEFSIAPLLAALRADNFSGPVSLEWEKLWHPYLPSLGEALRVAAERRWW
jgi:sugar phosphate isomerase/epimerase